MGILRVLLRLFVMLVILTVVGQIHFKGESLEHRYHKFVNDDKFQDKYWQFMTPATWTFDKIVQLVKKKDDLPKVR